MSKEMLPDEQMAPRVFGSEIEYGVSDGTYKTTIIPEWPDYRPHVMHFDYTGKRFYPDHALPEITTPECPGLRQVVLHELAGDELAAEAMYIKYPEIRLHRRCIAPNNPDFQWEVITTGYHENYATGINIWDEGAERFQHRQALLSHLATRLPLIGAGTFTKGVYNVAQKVHGLDATTHYDTVHHKPLLNLRDEPHAGGERVSIRRLHVTSGDANISPWATRLKFGSTSCVLRLLEYGEDVEDLFLQNPLEVARMTGGPIASSNKPVELQNGDRATPLEIQRAWLDRSIKLNERQPFPDDEQDVFDTWARTIEALERYHDRGYVDDALKQLDWFTKNEYMKRHPNKSPNAVDIAYDKVPDGLGYRLRRGNGRFASETPDADEIETAKTTPPHSRARLRGALILRAFERLQDTTFLPTNVGVNWDCFTLNGKHYPLGPATRAYDLEEIEDAYTYLGLN